MAREVARHRVAQEEVKRLAKIEARKEKRRLKQEKKDNKDIQSAIHESGLVIDVDDENVMYDTNQSMEDDKRLSFYSIGEDEDGNPIRKGANGVKRLLSVDVHKDPDYDRRVRDYTEAFRGMDSDGDGTITFEEFKELWQKSGFLANVGDIRILFNQVDVNGDDTITLDEFVELNERYAMPSTEEEIREAFRVFDKNNDGFITSDELKRILTKNLQMGEPMEEKDVDEILGYADNNKDGKIDYEEFLELMMKCFEDAVTQVPPRSSGAG